jgi:hypothetical protein
MIEITREKTGNRFGLVHASFDPLISKGGVTGVARVAALILLMNLGYNTDYFGCNRINPGRSSIC